MKILITGADGMLGRDLSYYLSKNNTIIKTNKKLVDIVDLSKIEFFFQEQKPELIINCAAYTDVNQAEIEHKYADEINFKGAKNVAIAAQKINSTLIHISTDYVFDGQKTTPYTSFDKPNPINYYGLSKLKGEDAVLNYCKNCYVVRTSWLFGNNQKSFPNRILEKLKNNEQIKVINDKIGTPTSTLEISKNILQVLKKERGIYHLACKNPTTWFEFAKEIAKISNSNNKIMPIDSNKLQQIAKRPNYSALESDFPTNDWNISLKNYIKIKPFDLKK